jgi:lipopolysaccharide export system permease protein
MRLNRRLELASARAAGVSIAAAAMPALAAAALSAGLSIAVVGPVAAALQSQAERTTVRLAGSQSGLVAVQNARFWIRQTHPEGRVIIRADRFLADGPSLVSPTFLIFDDDQRFLRRWDSERADLQQGGWQLMQAQSLTPDGRVNRKPAHRIPTDLTASQLRGGVDQPESMSIFALPAFIERAEQAGFAVTHHRFAFHERLAQPLLLMAMAALAAASAQHHARGRNPALLVGLALATGFFVFFATAVAEAFGRSGAAPVMLAAWTPPTAAFLIGIGALAQADST